ncbi:arylsulfatase A-like enzyme [Algoriphagus iocasae]|uniref:Arylsulfatase A-like enzyme n=1 Tax=Algoriphagus iocasae TaxID=1836499 RepID=A0A841MH81_9BACT|nr:sulfatase [Algoriphagus iocasae]MBB6327582.1 arylsulfatase A-like enzyme [Algoriphagus iocasae]
MKGIKLFILVVSGFALTALSCTEKKEIPKPNILFAIMDDVTYMHMSAYGCDWVNTPNFDRIASEGILFQNAYTPNAKCGPSRSNILTGRNSWQLEEAVNHWADFPVKFKTVAESLSENGYHVGYTGKGWAPGIAKNEDGSPRDLLVNRYIEIKLTPPTAHISNVDYAANFEVFLNEKESEEPFFFWYGGLEPHRGYEYGSGIAKGGKNVAQVKDEDIFSFWPKVDSVRTDLLDYAFEIEYFDKQLGKMLDQLEAAGELENTLIIVTSDNGMAFPRIKGQEYEYSNHLPLAMMWPAGIKSTGRKVEDLVSFIDLAPTFLEVAGISEESSGMEAITGRSLTDLMYADKGGQLTEDRNFVVIGKERHDVGRPNDEGYPIRGMIKDGMLYLKNFKTDRWPAGNPETGYLNTDGGATKTVVLNSIYSPDTFKYWNWSFGKRNEEELFDIKNDPDCMRNLAQEEEFQDLLKTMRRELVTELTEQGDPRMFGKGDLLESYTYTDKNSVNFYERYMNGEKVNFGWVRKTDFQNVSEIETYQQMEKGKNSIQLDKK